MLIGQIGWLVGQHSVFRHTDILGIGLKALWAQTIALVAFFESHYISPHGFDFSSQLGPWYGVPGPGEAVVESRKEWVCPWKAAVRCRHPSRMVLDQCLIALWDRLFHLLELKDIRWSISWASNGYTWISLLILDVLVLSRLYLVGQARVRLQID